MGHGKVVRLNLVVKTWSKYLKCEKTLVDFSTLHPCDPIRGAGISTPLVARQIDERELAKELIRTSSLEDQLKCTKKVSCLSKSPNFRYCHQK